MHFKSSEMENRYFEPESDPDDKVEYPNYNIMRQNYSNLTCYKLNKDLFAPTNRNLIAHEYFTRNSIVESICLNPKSPKLFGKLFGLAANIEKYNQTARTQDKYLDQAGFFPSEILIKESIESYFQRKYCKETRQNCLEVFYSQKFNSIFLINYDKELRSLDFYQVIVDVSSNQHQFRLNKFQSMNHEDINEVTGLHLVLLNSKIFLVFKYHNFYEVNEILENANDIDEFEMQAVHVQKYNDFFIKWLKINSLTGTIGAILVSADFQQFKISTRDVEGNLIFEISLPFHPINFDIYGPQDEILINSNSAIYIVNQGSEDLIQICDLKSDFNYSNTNILYNAFSFKNYKFFGTVTSSQLVIRDYRFPKNGILAFSHGLPVPPEQITVSKNVKQESLIHGISNIDDYSKFFDQLDCNISETPNMVYLYSLRKQGSISAFPFFDYQDKDDIKNPFVYKLVKEINTTIQKANKFMDLLDRDVSLTSLFTSNLKHENMSLTGLQCFIHDNFHFQVSVENGNVMNLQIMSNKKNENLRFCKFDKETNETVTDQVIKQFCQEGLRNSTRKARLEVEFDPDKSKIPLNKAATKIQALKLRQTSSSLPEESKTAFGNHITSNNIAKLKEAW
jgi:hypothetical protein